MAEGPFGGPRPFVNDEPIVRVFFYEISENVKENMASGNQEDKLSSEFFFQLEKEFGYKKSNAVQRATKGSFDLTLLGRKQNDQLVLEIPLSKFSLDEIERLNNIVNKLGEVRVSIITTS